MKTIKNLIVLSLLAGILFSANSSFTNGWKVAGPILAIGATSAIVSNAAANNAAVARDRENARYLAERDRAREARDIRQERAAERRHELELARIQAGQSQYPAQKGQYPVRNQYPVNENYYGGATTIPVEE